MQYIYLIGFLTIMGFIIQILSNPISWVIIGIVIIAGIIAYINSIQEEQQKAEQRAKDEKEYQELKNEVLNDLELRNCQYWID